ncbi:hypothetical protein M758_5G093100 [Ceratodon purpureus]|nr:hypothetical protein M758_5G093100 [Ceratodon purpureus]
MGSGISNSDASQSTSGAGHPPLPPSSTYAAIPAPVRAGRYRRESGLRSSVSVPSFSTYWKVPVEDPRDGAYGYQVPSPSQAAGNDGSASPKVVKPSRSGPLGSDGLPVSPPASRRWWYRGLSISVLIILGITLVYFGFLLGRAYLKRETLQFAIVLDGGSTGTRVHVHGWARSPKDPLPVMVDPTTNTHMPGAPMQVVNGQQRLYKRVETEPGLDKLYLNSTGIETALGPLLDWAGRHIPRHAYANTQIFLLATAGLRKLPLDQSEWILDQAWSVLAKSPFKCKRQSVKVIKGIEEAYYGWIALNYKFGRLGNMPRKSNYGTLDLGGSSLEVTFEPKNVPHGDYGMNLSVGATDHHLYAASHAGFGLNDAFEKSIAVLLRSQNATTRGQQASDGLVEVEHPCLQTGYRESYLCHSHCALPPLSARGSGRRSPSTDVATGAQLQLLGAPNWEACQTLAEDIINSSSAPCSVPPCALGKHQPYPNGQFYGLAGFYVVYKFFGLSQDAPLDDLLAKGQDFCKMPWKEAERSVDPQPSIEQYCFRSPYVTALLRDGLHLQDSQIQIGSGDFSWTLGAALWEAGALDPLEKSEGPGGITGYGPNLTITVVVLLLLVFILVGVTWYQWKQMRNKRRGYLPLSTSGSPAIWMPSHLRNQGRGDTKTPQSPQPGYNSAFAGELPPGSSDIEGLQMLASSGIASAKSTPDRRLLQSRRTASREELNLL